MKCNFCGKEFEGDYEKCPLCTQPIEKAECESTTMTISEQHNELLAKTPMKWYKFVIYFQLILGPLAYLGNALQYFMGTIYGEQSELVYTMFPKLKSVDIVYGVLLLAMAGFAIYVRYTLTEYYSKAPNLLKLYYGLNAFISLIYGIYLKITTSLNVQSQVPNLILSIVLIFATSVYFDNRKDLFIFSPD